MNRKHIITHALANGLYTVLYIILIALFLGNAESMFGDTKTPLIPMAMLMLLVFSAALCGALVFGRPILWYIEGKKREAVILFSYTMVVLFLCAALAFFALYLIK